MTLTEWHAVLAGFAQRRGVRSARAASPMRGADLAQLMQSYPDTKS